VKKQIENEQFRTHIPEPRWQQIASIGIVLAVIAFWIYIALKKF
jgi:hypothetical protein